VIEFLLAAALSLLMAYFVIRKAVFHAILDADAERRDDARRERMANEPFPDATQS
jgi:hypothetical protein